MPKEEMPAWMVCDGIISKMRDELLSQAVSVMHEQLEKKRISLEGQLPTLDEGASGQERDAFLLSQIIKEHKNIERQFGEYIEHAKVGHEDLARIEELQRFLLELRQIVMLSDYSKECEGWLAEAEKELKEEDPAKIMAKTMKKEGKRQELLDYVMKSKKFMKDGVFSEAERKIMDEALKITSGPI